MSCQVHEAFKKEASSHKDGSMDYLGLLRFMKINCPGGTSQIEMRYLLATLNMQDSQGSGLVNFRELLQALRLVRVCKVTPLPTLHHETRAIFECMYRI